MSRQVNRGGLIAHRLGTHAFLSLFQLRPPAGWVRKAEVIGGPGDNGWLMQNQRTGAYCVLNAGGAMRSVDPRRAARALAMIEAEDVPAPLDVDMSAAAAFRAARLSCGLTATEWASALGYASANPRQLIHDMESGRKTVTPSIARLAEMYQRHGIPAEFLTRRKDPAKSAPGDGTPSENSSVPSADFGPD